MRRYFSHLRDSTDEVLDPEGVELPINALSDAALAAARDCMAGDVLSGKLDLRYRIDVQDSDGDLVLTMPFSDAVEIISPS